MDGKWKCRGCGGICYGLEGHNRCRGCTDLDQRKAVAAAHASGRLAGQEAMRERAAAVAARDADGACNCGRPVCQPDCARVRLLDLADAIHALEVSHD